MIDKLTDRSRDINLGEKKDRAQPSSVNHRYCRSTKGRGSKADRGSARLKVYCGETFLSLLRETGVEEDNEELFHNFFLFFPLEKNVDVEDRNSSKFEQWRSTFLRNNRYAFQTPRFIEDYFRNVIIVGLPFFPHLRKN